MSSSEKITYCRWDQNSIADNQLLIFWENLIDYENFGDDTHLHVELSTWLIIIDFFFSLDKLTRKIWIIPSTCKKVDLMHNTSAKNRFIFLEL